MTTTAPSMPPDAVLLDAGGVFLLPEARRIVAAFERAEVSIDATVLPAAHYRAAAEFSVDLDVDADWAGSWHAYLSAYIDACLATSDQALVPEQPDREEVHRHIDSEFADAALWSDVIPAAVEALRSLAATGVALGVVSNADGIMAERLRSRDVLQVGPGLGVEVGCVIDSGAVGVMKPNPAIFQLGLTALAVEAERTWFVGDMPAFDVVGAQRAGIRPILLDPLGLHDDAPYDAVRTLADVAHWAASAMA